MTGKDGENVGGKAEGAGGVPEGALRSDAVQFLRLLLGKCDDGASDHAWRKCRRCLAVAQIENRDPLAVRFLTIAEEALASPPPAVPMAIEKRLQAAARKLREDEPYFVEVDENGCGTCGSGRSYTIVGPDGYASSTSYLDEEDADAQADALNAAYFQGRAAPEIYELPEGAAPPAVEALRAAKAVEAYAQWCGGVHDDGCPEDDTCDCSGKWINDGVTSAVNLLRGATAGAPAPASPPVTEE